MSVVYRVTTNHLDGQILLNKVALELSRFVCVVHMQWLMFDIFLCKYDSLLPANRVLKQTKDSQVISFKFVCMLNMIGTVTEIDSVDNDQVRTDCSMPMVTSRHVRLQSFVEHYGNEEPNQTTMTRIKEYLRQQYTSCSVNMCMIAFLNRIPLIYCLKQYDIRQNLFGDITSGMIVAAMHIPQGKHS
jgi:hypothetical protein